MTIDAAVDRLREATRTMTPCPPVRDLIGPDDISTAYAVQRLLVADRLAAGARVVGRKIGLTSLAVQQQLGVDRPDFGVLFADMEIANDGVVPAGLLLQPKIEADAFKTAGAPQAVTAWLGTLSALEIVDSRIAGWDITFGDTVADNASSGLFVLGDTRTTLAEIVPADVRMTMRLDGETVSEGSGPGAT